jgi:hypothetical protein
VSSEASGTTTVHLGNLCLRRPLLLLILSPPRTPDFTRPLPSDKTLPLSWTNASSWMPPIPALGAPVARGPRSKASPAEAMRKSARSKDASDGLVLESAMRAAADKNNLDKSVNDTTTPSSSTPAPGNDTSTSPFVAFQDSSIDHLLKVAKDSCILFKSTEGSPAQAVALLQARECAQAELLAVRRKIEEDAAKAKEEAARATSSQGIECGSPEVASKGKPASDAAVSVRRGSAGEPSQSSGKVKKTTITKRRAARKPTPVGHRPVTRQARALSKVSQ